MKKQLLQLALLLFSGPLFALELSPISKSHSLGDFDKIVESGNLRVLVSADLGFYYIEKGRPKGIIAEQLAHFEAYLQKSNPLLKIHIIPIERSDLFGALEAGYGDLAVANLTITPQRQQQVQFSTPFLKNVSELFITDADEEPIDEISDVSGQEVWVRASSSYFESIQRINNELSSMGLQPMEVRFIEETIQDYELMEMVNQDYIDLTVLDSHKAELWLKVMDNLKAHEELPLRTEGEIAWAMRQESPKLESTVNAYLKTAKKGTWLGNVIYEKYIDNTSWLTRALNPDQLEKLNDLSTVFKKYGEQYDIDWLMLSAQAFQESGLDNSKVSHRGAVGIMQVLPATASDPYINIPDIKDLDNNVHAGTKYMRFIHDRYFSDDDISANDKVYFSLAAYNAGPAAIRRMRTLATKHGYDPNKWFQNVEIITRRNIGKEPVTYVGNINRYYIIYKQLGLIRDQQSNANAFNYQSVVLESLTDE
jgi:membrane-bound lytic murein transglycosylase MltF